MYTKEKQDGWEVPCVCGHQALKEQYEIDAKAISDNSNHKLTIAACPICGTLFMKNKMAVN